MKCRRTACHNSVDVVCKHRDTGEMYCVSCARKINRACNEIVVHFPFVGGDAVILHNSHMGVYRVRLSDGTETDASYLWISLHETATS